MKKSILWKVLILLIASIVLAGCFHREKTATKSASLLFYGLDDSSVFEPLIAQYREKNPQVSIKYKKFNDSLEFENLLVNEIAEGEGPDIFYIHNTWLPRHSKKLVPLTSETLTPQNMGETFVNVTVSDFVQPDPRDGKRKIYALPLFVDTLALYYNKKHFEQKIPERGKPAATWDLIKEDASKLREQESTEEGGRLRQGAIAFGRADYISLSVDILYNFFIQAGVAMYDDEYKQVRLASGGQDYFDYFLSFASSRNKNYSYSADLVDQKSELPEVEAFLAGSVSSILAYSDLYPRLETLLKNVRSRGQSVIAMSDIAVARSPQVSTNESDYKVWADYYGLAISRNSKSSAAAWNFVQFLTSKQRAQAYHNATKRPTARRDLIEEQKKEPITEVFISQVGYGASYRVFSEVRFGQLLHEALVQAANGKTSREALQDAQTKMNEILKTEAPNGLYPKPKVKK